MQIVMCQLELTEHILADIHCVNRHKGVSIDAKGARRGEWWCLIVRYHRDQSTKNLKRVLTNVRIRTKVIS